jgi:pyruvate dehydrogenase E1 component alpha subunit
VRFRTYLQGLGVEQEFLDSVDEEAADHAADVRRRALEITSPDRSVIFDNVYAEPHPLVVEQQKWLDGYESSFDGSES